MSDSIPMPAALVTGLEYALNRYLALDPATVGRVARLTGKVIAVELRGLDMTFYLVPHLNGVKVATAFGGRPDTVLRGTPGAFARLGTTANPVGVLFSGDVEISGDAELGQRFKRILDGIQIDWEELLSTLVGDVLAHQLGNAARGTTTWLQNSAATLGRDIAEYLQEEISLLPREFEIEELLTGVDTLVGDTDRLEQRIRRLRRQLQGDAP